MGNAYVRAGVGVDVSVAGGGGSGVGGGGTGAGGGGGRGGGGVQVGGVCKKEVSINIVGVASRLNTKCVGPRQHHPSGGHGPHAP